MKVRDPVCGMMIESSTAAAQSQNGPETIYFCSIACQKKYVRERGAGPR